MPCFCRSGHKCCHNLCICLQNVPYNYGDDDDAMTYVYYKYYNTHVTYIESAFLMAGKFGESVLGNRE